MLTSQSYGLAPQNLAMLINRAIDAYCPSPTDPNSNPTTAVVDRVSALAKEHHLISAALNETVRINSEMMNLVADYRETMDAMKMELEEAVTDSEFYKDKCEAMYQILNDNDTMLKATELYKEDIAQGGVTPKASEYEIAALRNALRFVLDVVFA